MRRGWRIRCGAPRTPFHAQAVSPRHRSPVLGLDAAVELGVDVSFELECAALDPLKRRHRGQRFGSQSDAEERR